MRPIVRRLLGKQPPPEDVASVPSPTTPARKRGCARPLSRSVSPSPGPATMGAGLMGQEPAPGTPKAAAAGAAGAGAAAARRSLPRQSSVAATASGRCRRSLARRRSSTVGARLSFPHRDFDNPEAETCWLSCLFQSLWHSAYFHSVFDAHLVASKHLAGEEERILSALQQTWEEYRLTGHELEDSPHGTAPEEHKNSPGRDASGSTPRLISSGELAEAFGEGYGDMSEALALMVDELSQSVSAEAKRLADQIVLVPIAMADGKLPGPKDAWKLVEEWGATAAPILAVDLSLPPPKDGEEALCELWVASCGASVSRTADLGQEHRLVSLVCFMHDLQHYVAFCRRRSMPSKCIFFNDLPRLTPGAEKELSWSAVPAMCSKFRLTPRLVLYEADV